MQYKGDAARCLSFFNVYHIVTEKVYILKETKPQSEDNKDNNKRK